MSKIKELANEVFDIASFREQRKGQINMGVLVGGVIVLVIAIVITVIVLVQTTPQVFGDQGLNNTEYLAFAPPLLQGLFPLIVQAIWILIPVGLLTLVAGYAWYKIKG